MRFLCVNQSGHGGAARTTGLVRHVLACCLVAFGLHAGGAGAQTPAVNFLFEQVEVGESVAGATVTLTVVAEPAPTANLDIGYRFVTAQSTAAPADFTIAGLAADNTGTVRLTPTAPQATILVALVNDTADEGVFEDALFELVGDSAIPVRYRLGALFSTRLRIYDDDGAGSRAAPRLSFSRAESSATEGTTVNVEVRASPPPTGALTISYNAMPAGTATSGMDYTALSGRLTLAANAGSVNLPVVLSNDGNHEPAESLVLVLQAGSGYTLGSQRRHQLTIEGSDTPVISFALAMSTVAEPEGEEVRRGSIPLNQATIVLNLAPVPHRPIWVGYRVNAASTASAGTDYQGLAAPGNTGSLRLEAGVASRSVSLIIPSDPLREGTETMILELLAPADDYVLGTPTSHTLNITDSADDGSLPEVRFGSSAPVDVDEGGAVSIPLVVNGLEGATLSVSLQVDGDQTTADATDYTLPAATMVSTATGTMVQLQTNPDADTDDEILVLQIADSAGNYVTSRDRFADTSYVVRIRDTGATASGPMVQFRRVGSIASEARDGRSAVTHRVELERTGATTGTLSVMVAAVGRGDAVQGVTDFSLPSTIVTFAAGEATATLIVTVNADLRGPDTAGGNATINQDGAREGEQVVDLLLLPGSGYQLGERRHHRVTIADRYRLNTGGTCSLADGRSCAEAVEGDVLVFRGDTLTRNFSIRAAGNTALLDAPTDMPTDIHFCVENSVRAGDSSDARDGLDFIVLNAMRVPGGRCFSGGGFPFLVTVSPGQTRARIVVEIVDDDVPDVNRFEASQLPIPGTGVIEGSGGTFPIVCTNVPVDPDDVTPSTCVIIDNDEAPPRTPSVSFATATTEVDEDAGTVSIQLMVTNPPPEGLVLDYRIIGGNARPEVDYILDGVPAATRRGSLTVPPSGTAALNLWVLDDRVPREPDRNLVLALQTRGDAYTLGTQTEHTLTIEDDDAPGTLTELSFETGQLEVNESSGSATLVVRAAPPTTGPIPAFSVNYRVVAAETTALPAAYTLVGAGAGGLSGSLNFSNTARTASIQITLNDNDEEDVQPRRNLVVELLQPSPVTNFLVVVPARASVLINDDDGANMPTPRISFAGAASSGVEGSTVNVEVRAAPAPTMDLTIQYAVMLVGTPTPGRDDFLALSGTLVMPGDATSVLLPVTLLDDGLPEPPESVLLTLQPTAGYMLGSLRQHRIGISDANLAQVRFATTASLISEPDREETRSPQAPINQAEIELLLSPAPIQPIWVNYRVAPGSTASAGQDYLGLAAAGVTGVLRIDAGTTTRVIPLDIVSDRLREGTETLVLELLPATNPNEYTLGLPQSHTLSIADDAGDGALPVVRFGTPTSVEVTEGGAVNIPLVVDALEGATLSVRLAVVGGGTTTAELADYRLPAAAASVSTATGATLRLQTNQDDDRADEILVLQIADSTGYSTARDQFASTRFLVRIRDDEAATSGPSVEFVAAESRVEEPVSRTRNPRNHTVTLRRTGSTGSLLTVLLAAVGRGAAVSGATTDFSLPSTTVTFNAGQRQAQATVAINPDVIGDDVILNEAPIAEGEQVVELLLLPGVGYQLGAQRRHRVRIVEPLRLGSTAAACRLLGTTDRSSNASCSSLTPGPCCQATEGDVLVLETSLDYRGDATLTPFAGNVPTEVDFCVSAETDGGTGIASSPIGTDPNDPALDFLVLNARSIGDCTASTHVAVNSSGGLDDITEDGPGFRVTVGPGQARVRVLVQIVDDDRDEASPSPISSGPGGSLVTGSRDNVMVAQFFPTPGSRVQVGGGGSFPLRCNFPAGGVTCRINDNDGSAPVLPDVGFAAAASEIDEAAGTVSIPLAVTNPPPAGLVLDYRISGGNAQLGTDYAIDGIDTARLQGQTIATGATGSLVVNLVDDLQVVAAVTLELTLVARADEYTVAAAGATHVLTINDDDIQVPPEPVGSLPPQTLMVGGGAVMVDVSAAFTDSNPGDVLTYTAASDAGAIATVSVTGSVLTIAPVAPGAATITVTATDTGGQTAMQPIAVTVRAVNRPPAVPVLADQTLTETASDFPALDYQFAAVADPDGDAVSYSATPADSSPLPDWLEFDAATRTFSGMPPPGTVGVFRIRVTATDAVSPPLSASADFSLTLVPQPRLSRAAGTPAIVVEANLDGFSMGLVLSNAVFSTPLTNADFSIANSGNFGGRLTVDLVQRISDTRANVILGYSGTGLMQVRMINLVLLATGTTDGARVALLRSDRPIVAVTFPTAALDEATVLTRATLNGARLPVVLSNAGYINVPTVAQFRLNGVPAGVTVGAVLRESSQRVTLVLIYTGANPVAGVNVGVTVAASAHNRGVDLTTTNTLMIIDAGGGGVPDFGSMVAESQAYPAGRSITPLTLPQAGGGDAPLSYGLTPALPDGLSFNAATRVVSGTPVMAAATVRYTYTVTDRDGERDTLDFALTILMGNAPRFGDVDATRLNRNYVTTKAVSMRLPQATGGALPLSYSLTPALPPGLSLIPDPNNPRIEGTPTTPRAVRTYTYTVADADLDTSPVDEDTLEFDLSVATNSAPLFDPDRINRTFRVGATIALTLPEARGGNGDLRYSYRPGGRTLTAIGLRFNAATRVLSGTTTFRFDSDLQPGSSVLLGTVVIALFDVSDADDDTDVLEVRISLTVPDLAPSFEASVARQIYRDGVTITPLTLPAATSGTTPLTYRILDSENLPTGLMFDADTRVLSSTPTAVQPETTYTYMVTDNDSNREADDTDRLEFTIEVLSATAPLASISAISPRVLLQRNLNGARLTVTLINATYAAAPAASQFRLDTAISGLRITAVARNSPTEAILTLAYTGTGEVANETIQVVVTAAALAGASDLTTAAVRVAAQNTPPVIADPGTRTYTQGAVISPLQIRVTDADLDELTVTVSNLPAGLSFDSDTLRISGTPIASIETMVTITADDGVNPLQTREFLIRFRQSVNFGSETIADLILMAGTSSTRSGVPPPVPLPAAMGGRGGYTYAISPNLPRQFRFLPVRGLRLEYANIVAQPATVYTYTATDQDGGTTSLRFAIEIVAPGTATARLSATNRDVLTETNLDGATLTLTLNPVEYMPNAALQANQDVWFTLVTTGISGLTVTSLNRNGDTSVTLTLAHDGSALTADEGTIAVRVAAAAHSGSGVLTSTRVRVRDNLAPVITPPGAQIYAQGGTITPLSILVFDAESDALTVTVAPLPPGLTFEAGPPRRLVGTPTTGGMTTVIITVNDGVNPAVTANFDITVTTVALRFSAVASIPAQRYFVNSATELTLPPAFGGTAPLSVGISPTLPTGLGFNTATRVLSGTPIMAQAATDYTYSAMDSATPPALISLDFTIEVLPPATVADLDLNRDGVINSEDALGLYFAYQFESTLGDGDSGGSAASRRNLLARVASGGSRTLDDAGRQALVRDARLWQIVGLNLGGGLSGDLNGDGAIDVNDALGMYIAYTFGLDVGDGASGGTSTDRQNLLSEVADGGDLPSSDQGRQTFLMRANALRNAL